MHSKHFFRPPLCLMTVKNVKGSVLLQSSLEMRLHFVKGSILPASSLVFDDNQKRQGICSSCHLSKRACVSSRDLFFQRHPSFLMTIKNVKGSVLLVIPRNAFAFRQGIYDVFIIWRSLDDFAFSKIERWRYTPERWRIKKRRSRERLFFTFLPLTSAINYHA